MKRILIILALILLALVAWLVLRQPKQPPEQNTAPQLTNAVPAPLVSNVPPPIIPAANAFVRPDSIDEDHWNQLMLVRQLALEQNQPVEFYARVVDQNGQPVEGAKLKITLSRINEKMFETTNFFHMNSGDEIVHLSLELVSDAAGCIKITNMTGKALWIDSLEKEGYIAPQYEGGVAYESTGIRSPISDILMTNAWNPQRGYIFHLQKIEGK